MSADTGPTVQVVCFEEAGDCTLERIARETREGDRVVVLGPQEFAEGLRRFGMHPGVSVAVLGRTAGRFPWSAASALERSARVVTHGARAAAWAAAGATAAAAPETLPPEPVWPDGRRARVRRELGIASFEHAVLVAGDPSEWIDLSFPTRALSMAFVAGAPIRIVVSPRCARIAWMSRFVEDAASAKPFIVDERADRPWEILPALDAALVDQDGAATNPVECAGWRAPERSRPWMGGSIPVRPASPLPALWGIACGKPVFVHASVDLGAHAAHPLVVRFADDVAHLAREVHARASSASAASR